MPNVDAGTRFSFLACLFVSAAGALLGCTTLLGDDFSIGLSADAGTPTREGEGTTPGSGAGSCQPGQKDCAGNVVRTCNASGTWQTEIMCPNRCSDAACAGECPPGST